MTRLHSLLRSLYAGYLFVAALPFAFYAIASLFELQSFRQLLFAANAALIAGILLTCAAYMGWSAAKVGARIESPRARSPLILAGVLVPGLVIGHYIYLILS